MSPSNREGGKAQFWRTMLRQWRQSGLSVRAFCARQGLSQPSFYSWRRSLAQRDGQAVPFVPVRVLKEPQPVLAEASASGLELVLGGCRRLRIAPGFDAATLRQLLAVLEEDRP
jgi:transposase